MSDQMGVEVRVGSLPAVEGPHDQSASPLDSVAKLGEGWLARNNRIVAKGFLNQWCGLVAILESILLAWTPKIVLQHYRRLSRRVAEIPGGPGLTTADISPSLSLMPAGLSDGNSPRAALILLAAACVIGSTLFI
jgi:hypothetical protein